MKVNKTILAILKGKWLIDPRQAANLLPIVANVIKGTTEFDEDSELISQVTLIDSSGKRTINISAANVQAESKQLQVSEKTNAIVTIHGPIMKHDAACGGPVGSMTNAAIINILSQEENIDTIFIDIDSPGGMVDGTQTLSDAISNSPKNTVAFVNDGMACSAGYWIASSADKVYVTQKTDMVGSIGVYTTVADFQAYFASKGIPVKDIYSTYSTEKNKPYKDAVKSEEGGEGEALLKEEIDFIAAEFIAHVKKHRKINESAGDPFKGGCYYAAQALEMNLIDGIKSIDEILTSPTATSSSTSQASNNTQDNISDMNITEKLNELSAETDESKRANLVSALVAAFKAEEVFTKDEHEALVTTAVEAATEPMKAQITQLEAEITTLKKPADNATVPNQDKDTQQDSGSNKSFEDRYKFSAKYGPKSK